MLSRSVRPRFYMRTELFCAAFILTLTASTAWSQQLGGLPDLVERVAPSVVTVGIVYAKAPDAAAASPPAGGSATSAHIPEESKILPAVKDFLEKSGRQSAPSSEVAEKKPGMVSGMVLSADGHIVTVGHALDGALEVSVTLDDSTRRLQSSSGSINAQTSLF